MKIIIAIDGFSACGKSTLAKDLAKQIHYTYVDTGAMYRAITLYFLRHNVNLSDSQSVKDALNSIKIRFGTEEEGTENIFLNQEDVTKHIRQMLVADKVSQVAAIKEVRDFAVEQQQELGKRKGVVMDGRDIGTVVFPDAELKIFMNADLEVRIKRRFLEMQAKDPLVDLEAVKTNLQLRDYIDSNREESPLTQAADARVLDNSDMTQEEQLNLVLQWVKETIFQLQNA